MPRKLIIDQSGNKYTLITEGSQPAVKSIHNASRAVRRLREKVDPGHIPFIRYLENLAKDLSHWADELSERIDYESGERKKK